MGGMTLVLGNKRYSSWSLRPWLALRMAGLEFDEILVPLRQAGTKAAILAHSPSGKVPCLMLGDLAIWDSLAICEYAAEQAPGLWPADPAARAVARSVSAEMHSGFPALRNAMSMDVCAVTPMADIAAEVQADIDRIQALWADCRSRFGAGGQFLFGGFCIADAMYAPVCTRFVTYDVPLTPLSQDYVAAVRALPAMQDWTAAAARETDLVY